MFGLLVQEPAFWGFLGAFVYAAPRLLAAYYAARDAKSPWGRCIADFHVALLIGAVAAEGFEPWVANFFHDESLRELRAISTVIGLLANPAAPGVIDALSGRLIRRLRGQEP